MASRCAVSCVLVAAGAAGLWNALHAQRTPAIEGVRRLTRLVRDLLQSHAPGVVCGGFGI